ncbi:MAG: Nucleotide-binding universal stress protein [Candidatus Methanocomedens sp.]|nr:MAG: Nucleotide-binding universal stress protein [ANME-2 cluster archaeon]
MKNINGLRRKNIMKLVNKIQLVIDRSENSDNATSQAMKMAKKLNAEVSSLYVINTHMHQTPNVIEAMVRTGKKHLETLKDLASNLGVNMPTSKVLVGGPTHDILKETNANHSDFLIMGAGENSPKGSVQAKLIRKAKSNLMLVRDNLDDQDLKKILLLTNDTELEKAPLFAANLSKEYGAELTACHVVDVEEGLIKERVVYLPEAAGRSGNMSQRGLGENVTLSPTLIHKLKDDLTKQGYKVTDTVAEIAKTVDVDTKSVVLNGKPAEEIIRFARENDFDLIVMEHTKRGRLSQLISGSVPEKVARNVPCSVLMVNSAS